jgi:hypothetical protein
MADRPLHLRSDADLVAALRGLEPAVAWPSAVLPGGADLAATLRTRIEAMPWVPRGSRAVSAELPGAWRRSWRPARWALVLALVALLALAAIVGALVLGLPGLRISLGAAVLNPPPSLSPTDEPRPSASADVLGSRMNLGEPIEPGDPVRLDARAGFDVRLPTDPELGQPDAVYIDDDKGGQVTALWATHPGLPATLDGDVGLLLGQFRGTVDDGFFEKATRIGTTIERVQVAGRGGFWLSGDPHILFWESADGFVDDPRRWVGDVLLWSNGEITYRLETALDRDEAIHLAETLP